MDPKSAPSGVLLSIGKVPDAAMGVLGEAAAKAGDAWRPEADVQSALSWLEKQKPTAIALCMDPPEAARQAIALRHDFALAAVPIIGLGRAVSDLAFEEAFACGVDDVAALEVVKLGRRLRSIAEAGPDEVRRRAETVVIADADRDARLLQGRVFRDAGYTVGFALDAEEALRLSLDPNTTAVVASSAMDSGGEPLARRAAAKGSRAAWILCAPPKEMLAVRRRVASVREVQVTVHDAFAAPATLLFVANELINKPGRDVRKSARVLYGTSVRFRHAGRDDEDIGYSYNISEGGLYVRTLAPPARWDELWIELLPPRSDRLVHLEATTVWSRKYGPSPSASVPPGFGVEITGGSKTDLDRYVRGYKAFLAERVAPESAAPID